MEFLLSCTIWFYNKSYLDFQDWSKKSVKAARFHLVSYPKQDKAFKQNYKSAQIHSTLGPGSLRRVLSPQKPFEESGPSFKSVMKPVIRQASRSFEFPWEHLPSTPSSFVWFAGISFSLQTKQRWSLSLQITIARYKVFCCG